MLVSDKRPLPEISSCAALREGCLLSLVVGYRLKRSSAASNNYGSPWLKQLSVRGCRTPARYSRGNVAHISTSWTCPTETRLPGWGERTRTRKCLFFVFSAELLGFTQHFRTRDFSRTPGRDRFRSRRVKATFASSSPICPATQSGLRVPALVTDGELAPRPAIVSLWSLGVSA
jgi:hypothetical protein